MVSRFPVTFRPPAFASWSSCARRGAGPSLRSAYRSCCQGRTPTGLPRSALSRSGRVGCLLYPGAGGVRAWGRRSAPAACGVAPAWPGIAVWVSHGPATGDYEASTGGSLAFTRPTFPWPGLSAWLGTALGFTPSFAPSRCRPGNRRRCRSRHRPMWTVSTATAVRVGRPCASRRPTRRSSRCR